SRRFRFVEPYGGLSGELRWATRAKERFRPAGALKAYQNQSPPVVGELTAGLAIIPWDDRVKHQRAVIDLRLTGTYASAGRDYSPLFDALGHHGARGGEAGGGGDLGQYACVDGRMVDHAGDCSRPTPFNGLLGVGVHGVIGGKIGAEVQVAR